MTVWRHTQLSDEFLPSVVHHLALLWRNMRQLETIARYCHKNTDWCSSICPIFDQSLHFVPILYPIHMLQGCLFGLKKTLPYHSSLFVHQKNVSKKFAYQGWWAPLSPIQRRSLHQATLIQSLGFSILGLLLQLSRAGVGMCSKTNQNGPPRKKSLANTAKSNLEERIRIRKVPSLWHGVRRWLHARCHCQSEGLGPGPWHDYIAKHLNYRICQYLCGLGPCSWCI